MAAARPLPGDRERAAPSGVLYCGLKASRRFWSPVLFPAAGVKFWLLRTSAVL
jgi:hypothetical protein